ncbi:TRAP transporter small permease [Desertibacillus haloalkaliphilus]|uniref:TRAP transporter small permease n=1 Tax=Desertibacillus haloalkaliphilus TaxID=1328930 RepID=UPI001C251FC5|nr:TRAP transporter small permease [Desertibacillus haloalkaliphilus]MBU8907976.1 TRAP transporter small permease [Desertibacillus haloalkaliphilus]
MSKVLTIIEYSIVIISLSLMSILTFANVVSRYIMNYSLSFTEEVTVNLFVLLIFTGAAIGIHRGSHLGFSLLYDLAHKKIKMILTVLIGMITIIIFSLIVYYSFDTIQFQMMVGQKSPALGWPLWIFSTGLFIGGMLCLIRSVQATINQVSKLAKEGGA